MNENQYNYLTVGQLREVLDDFSDDVPVVVLHNKDKHLGFGDHVMCINTCKLHCADSRTLHETSLVLIYGASEEK